MQTQTPTQYTFPAELTKAIITYLGTRPWSEVNNMQVGILNLVDQQNAAAPLPTLPEVTP